jgi:ribosomal protein S12 methylthiotransferase
MESADLSALLRELNQSPGEFWVRILYTHPAHWTDSLIETIAACSKVARYIDLPLQHIHPVMLERMRRETTREYLVELIAKIRRHIPGIALRTTFIVGFPGESENHFEELLDFIRATRFERLGVFTYSAEEGTRAARMAGQVPERIKRRRRNQAMALQRKIAREIQGQQVGHTRTVLIEKTMGVNDALAAEVRSWEHGLVRRSSGRLTLDTGTWQVARGESDAPDIDGRVYVRGPVPTGQFIRVRVIGHTDYDLIAEPV